MQRGFPMMNQREYDPISNWTLFQGLMPIHCCAMQGRVDVMRLMIRYDQDGAISELLNAEEESKPPSLLHLALANSFMDCSNW